MHCGIKSLFAPCLSHEDAVRIQADNFFLLMPPGLFSTLAIVESAI
jgi:hypothetical protein